MPAEEMEQVFKVVERKKHKQKPPVLCPRCGSEFMKRLRRSGFLQCRIYALLGYYPWRCTKCHGDFMLRRRGSMRRHREPQPDVL